MEAATNDNSRVNRDKGNQLFINALIFTAVTVLNLFVKQVEQHHQWPPSSERCRE